MPSAFHEEFPSLNLGNDEALAPAARPSAAGAGGKGAEFEESKQLDRDCEAGAGANDQPTGGRVDSSLESLVLSRYCSRTKNRFQQGDLARTLNGSEHDER